MNLMKPQMAVQCYLQNDRNFLSSSSIQAVAAEWSVSNIDSSKIANKLPGVG